MKGINNLNSVLSVSHTDLDGFGCQLVLRGFVGAIKTASLTCYNIDYGDMHDFFSRLIDETTENAKRVKGDIENLEGDSGECKVVFDEVAYDMLVISDLNVPLEIVEKLHVLNFEVLDSARILLVDHHTQKIANTDTPADISKYSRWYKFDASKSATKALFDDWGTFVTTYEKPIGLEFCEIIEAINI